MIASACYGFLLFLLGVVAYCAVYRSIHQRLFITCAFLYVGRCALYVTNTAFGLFAPKYANDWGLYWVEYHFFGNLSVPSADTFAVQGLLIAPLYQWVTDPIFLALAVNTAAYTIAGYAVGRFAFQIAPPGKAAIVFLIFNLFPAANYFVMFGLRDPVILAGTTMFMLGVGRYLAGTTRSAFNGETIIGALVMLASRPELAVIFVPSIGIIGMRVAARKYRGGAAQRIKPVLYLLAILLLIPASYVSYRVAASEVGYAEAGITTLLDVYGQVRYERQFTDKDLSGDESPIIPPEMYSRLPTPVRVAVQTAGILLLPFPWLINQIQKALAFADSLLFIGLLWWLSRYWRVREVRYGLFVFAVALLGLGTTVSNFGNAFRMRLVLFPVLVVALTFAFTRERRDAA